VKEYEQVWVEKEKPKKRFSWGWCIFWLIICFPIGVAYWLIRR
jgi:hypothetical protein